MGTRIFNADTENKGVDGAELPPVWICSVGKCEPVRSEPVPVSPSAERAVYVRISTNPVVSTEFYHGDTVMVDVDERGHAVGVEVLDALDIGR